MAWPTNPARWRALLTVLLVLAGLLAACSPTSSTAGLAAPPTGDPGGWQGTVFADPLPKPDLVLTDTAGSEFDLRAETDGVPTLLYFGYASCPDICPVTLATIATAMGETGISTRTVKVVFVSVDPARDTPAVVAGYLDNFAFGFIGLTGGAPQVAGALDALGLPQPTYGEPDGSGSYPVGHPADVIAFGADNLAHLSYPFGVRGSQWAADLVRLAAGELP